MPLACVTNQRSSWLNLTSSIRSLCFDNSTGESGVFAAVRSHSSAVLVPSVPSAAVNNQRSSWLNLTSSIRPSCFDKSTGKGRGLEAVRSNSQAVKRSPLVNSQCPSELKAME